jgi:methyl-accepting chemotaxis protein
MPPSEPIADAAPTRFRDALVGRTVLLGILPMAATVLALIAVGAGLRYDTLRRSAERELQRLAAAAALDLDREADDAVDLARTLAEAQAGGLFGMRRLTLSVLKRAVEANPWCLGTYVCYEPDADGKDAASLAAGLPEGSIDGEGRFLPYWFRDPAKGGELSLKINRDLDTSLYYDGVRRAFRASGRAEAMVTEPYFYDGDLLVEQTYPIVVDGRFMGIAGADRSLASLREEALRIAEAADAAVLIVSGRGRIVATSLDGDEPGGAASLATLRLAESPFAEAVAPLLESRGEAGTIRIADDPRDGEATYWAAAAIETGDWTVVLARPVSAITGPLLRETAAIAAAAVLLVAAVSTLLVAVLRAFASRIRAAVAAAVTVAGGDLATPIAPSRRRDEASVLLRTIESMRRGLAGLVGRVKLAAISLHTATTEVAAAGRQQEQAAADFEHSAAEIGSAVHQISRTSEALVAAVVEVRTATDEAATLAEQGRGSLAGMRQSMGGLEEGTGSIAERLAAINERAVGINRIVTTIAKVADQTNLLSVNAAIEAEKAGEHGRGFLVVAREIRRLADQSAAATVDIERMVGQMQSAVSAGVMEMDRFAELVRSGCGETEAIGSQMERIIEQVATAAARFATLDEGVRQQSAGAEQIDGAMARLRDRAREGAESVREFANASEELQRSLASLRSVIDAFRLPS